MAKAERAKKSSAFRGIQKEPEQSRHKLIVSEYGAFQRGGGGGGNEFVGQKNSYATREGASVK